MRTSFSKLGAAAVVLLGMATSAQSGVRLDLTDVGAGINMFCDSTAFAACGAGFSLTASGGLRFEGTVGGFSVDTTSFSSNLPGTASAAILNGSTTQITRTGSGQGELRIDLSGFGYTLPAGEFKTLRGRASVTTSDETFGTGDLVFNQFIVDPGNGFPVVGDPTRVRSCTVTLIADSGNCSTSVSVWQDADLGTFSMRDVQLVRLTNGHTVNTTISGTVGRVPEPMTLSLVGVALLGVAAVARRRVNKA
jgi:hypothetical protein